jgi:hypothetical protein
VVVADRSSTRHRRRRPDDGLQRERLRALAHERRRFGYRRLYVLLRREGYVVNRKRVNRLYCEERLMVRRRGGRKRAQRRRTGPAADRVEPALVARLYALLHDRWPALSSHRQSYEVVY